MARQFTNYFDAVMFYDSQLEKLEKQIKVLVSEYKDLRDTRDFNKKMLDQERILNR